MRAVTGSTNAEFESQKGKDMKNRILRLLATAAIFSGPGAMAQDNVIDYLVTECQSDLETYCSQVTPGNGRLLHCVAAHEDKISGQCDYALYRAANLLQQLSAAITYVARECKTDIETHCNRVEVGNGKILACLLEHEEEIAESCKTAIADTVGE
jgi:hypothetical protein